MVNCRMRIRGILGASVGVRSITRKDRVAHSRLGFRAEHRAERVLKR